jgi:hypothetical protein
MTVRAIAGAALGDAASLNTLRSGRLHELVAKMEAVFLTAGTVTLQTALNLSGILAGLRF